MKKMTMASICGLTALTAGCDSGSSVLDIIFSSIGFALGILEIVGVL